MSSLTCGFPANSTQIHALLHLLRGKDQIHPRTTQAHLVLGTSRGGEKTELERFGVC